MNYRPKLLTAILATLTMALLLTACSGIKSLDVVGQNSITALDEILKTIPDQVSADEINVGWSLTAPDQTARFVWSEDYSRSPLYDVQLELDAKPFLDAGLDPSKLPNNYSFYEGHSLQGTNGSILSVGKKLGNDKLTYSGKPTALAAYEQIVNKYRSVINYHTSLDHYGVKLGDGNMFEWAKDMKTNSSKNINQDKDIVFVLNPEPLIAAGVDPNKVSGWVYTQLEVEEDGKKMEVWKLLKPFNLK